MLYKILFLIGLLLEVIGQALLTQGNEFVYQLKPIDFAHWSLLLGVAFMIPQIVSFPKSIVSYVGSPLAYAGAICIIGMCVLDFIWWSQPNQEARNELASHLYQVPSIWQVFIKIGPSSKIFNLGLMLLAFNYFKEQRAGVVVVVIATLVLWNWIPLPLRAVSGYTLTLLGYGLLFFKGKEGSPSV